MVSGGQADIRFAPVYRSFEDIRPLYGRWQMADRGEEIAKLEK